MQRPRSLGAAGSVLVHDVELALEDLRRLLNGIFVPPNIAGGVA